MYCRKTLIINFGVNDYRFHPALADGIFLNFPQVHLSEGRKAMMGKFDANLAVWPKPFSECLGSWIETECEWNQNLYQKGRVIKMFGHHISFTRVNFQRRQEKDVGKVFCGAFVKVVLERHTCRV